MQLFLRARRSWQHCNLGFTVNGNGFFFLIVFFHILFLSFFFYNCFCCLGADTWDDVIWAWNVGHMRGPGKGIGYLVDSFFGDIGLEAKRDDVRD